LFLGKKVKYLNEREIFKKLWLKENEIFLQTFNKNNYLNWHDDRDDFAIYLFYMNYSWKKSYWGFLELWYKDKKWKIICYEKIKPELNTFVLFKPKENCFHRVWKILKDWVMRKWIVEHLIPK
jgi:Rps23 Pro-64 3,4-dihydroxylase Tpa1-like proline 4-hydroxylase